MFTISAAVIPAEGPIRMSKGPSRRKLNPLSAESTCEHQFPPQHHPLWFLFHPALLFFFVLLLINISCCGTCRSESSERPMEDLGMAPSRPDLTGSGYVPNQI